ncbi:MAG TPA: hypothetical protein VN109_02465, partial [Devosia sp.]|nr:hypothetical protein [Devosia sp.]
MPVAELCRYRDALTQKPSVGKPPMAAMGRKMVPLNKRQLPTIPFPAFYGSYVGASRPTCACDRTA